MALKLTKMAEVDLYRDVKVLLQRLAGLTWGDVPTDQTVVQIELRKSDKIEIDRLSRELARHEVDE